MRCVVLTAALTAMFAVIPAAPDLWASGDRGRGRDEDGRGHGPRRSDPVLLWNEITLAACVDDHSGTFGAPSQGGPTRASRAFAIVHLAIYDAVNSIERTHRPYVFLAEDDYRGASIEAAVAQAAHDTLVFLFPDQELVFAVELADALARVRDRRERQRGIAIGRAAALAILEQRMDDGADEAMFYSPLLVPGVHRVDPINPDQGYLTPMWGEVTPFALEFGAQFRAPPPPALDSPEYAEAFNQVKWLGGDGVTTPTLRTPEQTEIGLYWAYDGSRRIGVPPRMYNQIARVIAEQERNSVAENARLFALINMAMADAGICCWETKYHYAFWRPVLAIREADAGDVPVAGWPGDGNADTDGDPTWTPLGAPASNGTGLDFTPPFPAYASGHATFGAATFRTLRNFYGTDRISFKFVSDELNGVTTDADGVTVRPRVVRRFRRLSEAAEENAISRIYLGIHWSFDATEGVNAGNKIADYVSETQLQPVRRGKGRDRDDD